MISKELLSLLISVACSWQVIAVTIAIILYFSIISSVAKTHRRPRVSRSPAKRRRKEKHVDTGPIIENSANEDLGLEEE